MLATLSVRVLKNPGKCWTLSDLGRLQTRPFEQMAQAECQVIGVVHRVSLIASN